MPRLGFWENKAKLASCPQFRMRKLPGCKEGRQVWSDEESTKIKEGKLSQTLKKERKKSVVCRQRRGERERRPQERRETQGKWGRGGNPDPRGVLRDQARACEVLATQVSIAG